MQSSKLRCTTNFYGIIFGVQTILISPILLFSHLFICPFWIPLHCHSYFQLRVFWFFLFLSIVTQSLRMLTGDKVRETSGVRGECPKHIGSLCTDVRYSLHKKNCLKTVLLYCYHIRFYKFYILKYTNFISVKSQFNYQA